jgi:acetyl esterase/lipase
MSPCFVLAQATSADPGEGRVGAFVYKQTEQRELELLVNFPANWSESDSRPAIVFFFGGGWAFSAPKHFERQAEYFASRGVVAIRPDFRVKDPDGTSPAESVADAKSAIRWVRSHADVLGVDPNRIVASGGSSGGHLAACTAQCSGPEDADENFSTSSEPDAMILFNPLLQYSGLREVEQAYPVASDLIARQISPILHVDVGDPPALLLFGREDTLLKWAFAYIEKSKGLENRVELYVAEGEGHAFFNDSPWYEHTLVEADNFLVSLGYLEQLPVTEKP